MYSLKVKADIENNRLHFIFSGVVTRKEMEKLYTDVRFCVADLQPDFDVIADYSACSLLQLDCIPVLQKIMSYLLENGLGEIARVLNQEQLATRQLLNLAAHVQGYKPVYAGSVEEAEEKLENQVQRQAIRVCLHGIRAEYTTGSGRHGGRVLDMSIGGCAIEVEEGAILPDPDEEIEMQVEFVDEKQGQRPLQLTSRVVRTADNLFAVQFIDLDDESRNQLWQNLLVESRR